MGQGTAGEGVAGEGVVGEGAGPALDGRSAPKGTGTATVRVVLPAHLRVLARIDGELSVEIAGQVTPRAVLDAVEAAHPVLRGTIRDRGTGRRRAFVRFFAAEEDLSHEPLDTPLPAAVARGAEPFMIVGAMAGG